MIDALIDYLFAPAVNVACIFWAVIAVGANNHSPVLGEQN